MTPTLRMKTISPRAAAELAERRDVSGLAEYRSQAVRALDQTRAARSTGDIAKVADEAVKQIETGLTGMPEAGPEGTIVARVVASADSQSKAPAIPLSGLLARLKVNHEIVAENDTNAFGVVDFEIPKAAEGSYEIEVLAPDCSVLVCQSGKFDGRRRNPVHRIETPRSGIIKSQIERSKPIEEGILQARERAKLVREVANKALAEQEKVLVKYLEDLDAELQCESKAAAEEKPRLNAEAAAVEQRTEIEPEPTTQEPEQDTTKPKRRRSGSEPKSK
ncbi:MAG TPA: hypothetical protein VER03_16585 [Bryobacteraceae bacterium]|nr:hypothetical protein [Bryobacteraceae bacterium]